MEVKSALNASEAKIQQLLKVNCHLSEELRLMQSKVRGQIAVWHSITAVAESVWLRLVSSFQLNSLQNENSTLKWQTPNSLARSQDLPQRAPPRGCRAMSMYETGSGPRQYHPRGETVHPDTTLTLQPLPSNVSTNRTKAKIGFGAPVSLFPLVLTQLVTQWNHHFRYDLITPLLFLCIHN